MAEKLRSGASLGVASGGVVAKIANNEAASSAINIGPNLFMRTLPGSKAYGTPQSPWGGQAL
jgi:hypothetical protein